MNIHDYKNLVSTALAIQAGRVEPIAPTPGDYREVYDEVKRLIGGGQQRIKELKTIMQELAIRHAAYGDALEPYYGLLSVFRDAARSEGTQEVSNPDWPGAILHVLDNKEKIFHWNHTAETTDILNKRQFEVGKAIRKLRDEGFEVEISQGKVRVPADVMKRLADEFDATAQAIGGEHLLVKTFSDISATIKLCPITEHFNLIRRVSTGVNVIGAQTPWGFIVQLGMKHIAARGGKQPFKAYDHLKSLATAAIAIFDMQPYNPWESAMLDHSYLIEYLQNSVQYDSIFTLNQMRGSHAQCLYQGLFTSEQVASLNFNGVHLRTAIKLADEILKETHPLNVVLVKPATLAKALGYGIRNTADLIDRAFAHPILGPNQALSFPPLAKEMDSMFRPLLKLHSGDYLLMPRSIVAPGLVEAIVQLARYADPKIDGTMGTTVEHLLRRELARKNVIFKTGKYDFRTTRSSAEKNQASDCDLVVESSTHVVFLECKSKVLTRAARSGEDVDILVDLTKSLVHSQVQAMRHEKFLKTKPAFVLHDDEFGESTVALNNRHVERMSVSLHDYNSLQDPTFLMRYLAICCNSTFDSTDRKMQGRLDDLKEKMKNLKELAVELGEFDGDHPRPFSASTFMSVPKILLLLERATDNESFLKEFRRNRSVSFSTRDFYSEYAAMLNMKISAENKTT